MRPMALKGPPAVWAAFATQGRWKNWLLLGQLLVNLAFLLVLLVIAQRPPDVIVVGQDGQGAYVPSAASSAALADFLRQQRGKPSDLTVLAFTQRFVRLTAGVNSTTVDEAWTEALSMMMAPLAERMLAEAKAQKMLEAYRLAQIRTSLDFASIDLVERRGDKAHVRVRLKAPQGATHGRWWRRRCAPGGAGVGRRAA